MLLLQQSRQWLYEACRSSHFIARELAARVGRICDLIVAIKGRLLVRQHSGFHLAPSSLQDIFIKYKIVK